MRSLSERGSTMKSRKKNSSFVLCFVLLLLFLLRSESPAVMEGLSTEDLTRASDLVIEGEVINVRTFWSKDGTSIISRATVLQNSVIRGHASGRHITVEYEGGEIGDIGLRVSDVAPLETGEKVILFLQAGASRVNGAAFRMVGKGQGKYSIGSDGIARKGGFSVIGARDLIDSDIPVSDLIDKIRKVR